MSGAPSRKRGRTLPTTPMPRYHPIIDPGPDAKRQRLSGSKSPKPVPESRHAKEVDLAPTVGCFKGMADASFVFTCEPYNQRIGRNSTGGGGEASRQIFSSSHGEVLSSDGFELMEIDEEFEEWVQVKDAPDETEFVLIVNLSSSMNMS